MSLTKQAKTLTTRQVESISRDLVTKRNGLRNQTIFLLSVKAGLRAKEISHLKWSYVVNSDLSIDDYIRLPNSASKGNGGREIPIHPSIKANLHEMLKERMKENSFFIKDKFVVNTERSDHTSSQHIINWFISIYKGYGLTGCSSHSGRRTFITNIARKISLVGGSMRDVQYLAGHSSLQVTQRYVESCSESKVKVINLI